MSNIDCIAGCPPSKVCYAKQGGAELCGLGTSMPPNGSGTPCCMVDDNITFLRTARVILMYSGQQEAINPEAVDARAALRHAFLSMPQYVYNGVGLFSHGRLKLNVHHLPPHLVDDLFQLLENVLPQSGYAVEVSIPEMQRQPLQRRRKVQNQYWCLSSMASDLPYNVLLLATNLRIHVITPMDAHEVVTLVLRALSDRDRNPAEARVFFQTNLPLGTNISNGLLRRIRNAMRTSVFRGRILLHFAGDILSPFEQNVPMGARVIDRQGSNQIGVIGNITVGEALIELSLT